MNPPTTSGLPAPGLGAFAGCGASHRVGAASSVIYVSRLPVPPDTPEPSATLHVDDEAELALWQIIAGLRTVRQGVGLTQNALSSHLPVRGRAISEWETGQMEPTLQHLMQWCRALDQRLVISSPDGELWQGPSRPRAGESWEFFERRRLAWPLRNRRRASGLSQAGLGQLVSVSRDSIQRWELLRVPPRPIALVVWAQKLGCSVVLRPVCEPGLV
ncbi:helix-turn-helix transcriptional regulator [Catenulispora pinisilvae]|uniref:helix-turn-helix transcriptional regulator n=1 Tax=Catenulispora pinisilvae TaxID=2705253 RepID=UPI001891A279|nr:helix-turn-helix transcriptional regulator [Catenulispora pinisilvae]